MINNLLNCRIALFILVVAGCGDSHVNTSIESGNVEVLQEFYSDGTLRLEIQLLDGKKHGFAKLYYPSGKIAAEGTYQDNVEVGKKVTYHENGKPNIVEFFNSEGRLDGERREYFEDGSISLEGTYADGKRTGIWIEYSPGGVLSEVNTLVDDKYNGIQKVYDENGILVARGNAINDLQEGEWFFFNSNGDTTKIVTFSSGKQVNIVKLTDS